MAVSKSLILFFAVVAVVAADTSAEKEKRAVVGVVGAYPYASTYGVAPGVGYVAPAAYHHHAAYAAPAVGYAGAATYAAPAVAYSAPAVGYAAPAATYAAPAVAYSAPAVGYAAPAATYGAPAVAYAGRAYDDGQYFPGKYEGASVYSAAQPAINYA